MATGTGSLSSLRELNRLKIVDFLRTQRHGEPGRRRPPHGPLALDRVHPRGRPAAARPRRRPRGRQRRRGQAGPPRHPDRARPLGRRGRGRRLRPRPRAAWPCPTSRAAVLAEAWHPWDVDHDAEGALDLAAETIELRARRGRRRIASACSAPAWPSPARSTSEQRRRSTTRPCCPDWAGVDAADELEKRVGVPTYVDNDANLRRPGRGHARRRAQRPLRGLRVDLVGHRRGHRSSTAAPTAATRGTAGEIGHVVVDPQGPICRCGNRGCLETLASSQALREPACSPAATTRSACET